MFHIRPSAASRRPCRRPSGVRIAVAALLAAAAVAWALPPVAVRGQDAPSMGGEGADARSAPAAPTASKVVILGFDGADHAVTAELLEAGELPNFARLRDTGHFGRLETTNPAQSPVSWAAFNTGTNPGKTSICDFLRRDPETYSPALSMARPVEQSIGPGRPARLSMAGGGGLLVLVVLGLGGLWIGRRVGGRAGGILRKTGWTAGVVLGVGGGVFAGIALDRWVPYEVPVPESQVRGQPLWQALTDAGRSVRVVQAPVSFPAPELGAHGELLCGFGTPDMQGTPGYWAIYTTGEIDRDTGTGGTGIRLRFRGDTAEAEIAGPDNVLIAKRIEAIDAEMADASPERQAALMRRRSLLSDERATRVPMTVTRRDGALDVTVQDVTQTLQPGEWSELFQLRYTLSPLMKLTGNVRFHLESVEPEIVLYRSPVNFDPLNLPPTVRLSHPMNYAPELAERYGNFETLGWQILTMPLKDRVLDEDTFLDSVDFVADWREEMILGELERGGWDMFMGVLCHPDRVQHILWRYRDEQHPLHPHDRPEEVARYRQAIVDSYKRMDAFVGKVMEAMPDDAVLLVVSDHGFQSYRRGVNINSFLVETNRLTPTAEAAGGTTRRTLEQLRNNTLHKDADWSKTQAYALGLGEIYINLEGRESKGIVKPSDYDAVCDAIRNDLLALRDPETGAPVVKEVYKAREIYHGDHMHDAPDLVIGFHKGYRVSWDTSLGGMPFDENGEPLVIEDNTLPWSGDHCSVDPSLVPGILLSNRPLTAESRGLEPAVTDIAPSVLRWLGVTPPERMDGRLLDLDRGD